jgi:hypothetical protein
MILLAVGSGKISVRNQTQDILAGRTVNDSMLVLDLLVLGK